MSAITYGGTRDEYSSQTHPFVPVFDGMAQRAAKLYPHNQYLQDEWRRAVAVVRATTSGWVLDRDVPKVAA